MGVFLFFRHAGRRGAQRGPGVPRLVPSDGWRLVRFRPGGSIHQTVLPPRQGLPGEAQSYLPTVATSPGVHRHRRTRLRRVKPLHFIEQFDF